MSKLDRIAIAIHNSTGDGNSWEGLADKDKEVLHNEARAALTELRNPDGIPPSQFPAWQANIDAILRGEV